MSLDKIFSGVSEFTKQNLDRFKDTIGLRKSTKDRYGNIMELGRAAALAAVVAAGCVETDGKNTPPAIDPHAATAMATMQSQENGWKDPEVEQLLAGVSPLYTDPVLPKSPYASLGTDTATLNTGNTGAFQLNDSGDRFPFLTSKSDWSFRSPVTNVRDIGAGEVPSVQVAKAEGEKKIPEKAPSKKSDARGVAGKDESDWLALGKISPKEWQLTLLKELLETGEYNKEILWELEAVLKKRNPAGVEVHLVKTEQPANGLSGAETLKDLTGYPEVTPENMDTIFRTVLNYHRETSKPKQPEVIEKTVSDAAEQAEWIVKRNNEIEMQRPHYKYKDKLAWYLNSVLSATDNTTPEKIQELFLSAPSFIAHMTNIGSEATVRREALDALNVALENTSSASDVLLQVHIHWQKKEDPLVITIPKISDVQRIVGSKGTPGLIATQYRMCMEELLIAQEEAKNEQTASTDRTDSETLAHPTLAMAKKITRASLDADIAAVTKQQSERHDS